MGQHEMPLGLIHLVAHAAESRIDVLVVRLEPVAERTAKHAHGGTGTAAFHHVMCAVKEVGGISRVELKWLKTGKGREWRYGPLPSIPHQIADAESAVPLRKGSDGRGIPALEIEISETAMGSVRSPGEWLFLSVWPAIRGAMPLCFGGQGLSCPARVGAGFCLTQIDRPVERERDVLKHCPVAPFAIHSTPEHGMRDGLCGLPVPVSVLPKGPVVIAPGGHEFQI